MNRTDLPCGPIAVVGSIAWDTVARTVCRTGIVLERDVAHGLANEEFGTFNTWRERVI